MFGYLKNYVCYYFILLMSLVSDPTWASDVYFIEIRGTINPGVSRYLARAIETAVSTKADFLLIELDTPGGLVSSVREMAQTIDQSKIPVLVFTAPAGASATSAGAILMISSHLAAMAPGTNIGAAHPVVIQGEEMKANLIEVIATDKQELWKAIDKRQILVGQNKIILKTDPPPNQHFLEMTLGEKILNYLSHPNIAALLMTFGILLIYSELSAPGIGFGGILGGLCLIVAFMAFQALPIQAGGLVLLGLGVLLIISEIFVESGGALAFGGSIALILGLLWVVDPVASDLRISPWVIGSIGLVMMSGTMLIGYGVSRIKKQSVETLKRIGGGDLAGVKGYQGKVQSIAPDGKSGQVQIRGESWKFVSKEPLKQYDNVIVQQSNGLTLDVVKNKE